MSEIQNGLSIAVLTGVFTIIGIVVGGVLGSVLEYLREKSRYTREIEKDKKKTEEENKRSYLSPLLFQLTRTVNLTGSVLSVETLSESKEGFLNVERLYEEIKEIKELMKNNMHVLPFTMNTSLIFYVGALESFADFVRNMKDSIRKASEKMRKTIPKEFLENWKKLAGIQNDMQNTMACAVYAFMEFNKIPELVIDVNKVHKELQDTINAMKIDFSKTVV